jgi:hypothetical protein
VLQSVGILAVTPVSRPARGLDVSDFIGLRPENAEKCLRVHGAGTDLDVIRLLKDAIAFGPKCLKLKYKILESWTR